MWITKNLKVSTGTSLASYQHRGRSMRCNELKSWGKDRVPQTTRIPNHPIALQSFPDQVGTIVSHAAHKGGEVKREHVYRSIHR